MTITYLRDGKKRTTKVTLDSDGGELVHHHAVAGPLVEASDYVVHFAAETHVDRSILAAGDFIKTDVEGTFVLLEAARRAKSLKRFIQRAPGR